MATQSAVNGKITGSNPVSGASDIYYMKKIPRVINVTNGEEVRDYFETVKDAERWIREQDIPEMYELMEASDDY